MKSVLTFFLGFLMLSGSLLPQNDVAELSKLPQLVQHYRFHHSVAGGGLSLSEFLTLHYGPASVAHYQCVRSARHSLDHESLPLHNHHDCVLLPFVLPAGRPAVHARPAGWPATAYRKSRRPLYAFAFSSSLLQPPRA